MARRTVLFSPGDRPELLRKAPGTGADVVVFDLEDAVAVDRKPEARANVRSVLSDPAFDPDCEVCVRVNPVGVAADDDLHGVFGDGAADAVDSVVLPKVASADDVRTFERLLGEHDAERPVLALVETASGVLAAAEIAAETPTDALVFGAEDFATDVGATRTPEGTEVLHAREHVVLAAAAGGVDAIDTVYTDYEDVDGLRTDARFAARLGYDGKLAIHPVQVEPIREAFTPPEADVEWAERVLAARDEAAVADRAVFDVDGEMVDAPMIRRAEAILERAEGPD